MKKRAFLMVSVALLAAGCDKQMMSGPDAQKWLSSQNGPKVEGVQAALLKSAHDSDVAGDWRTAAAYYQQLADKNPENQEFQVALADDFRRMGDTGKAMPIYENVLKKDPTYAPALEGKGLALMQAGNFDTAVNILLQLAQSGRASWRTYNAVGIIASSKQSTAAGKPYFDQALKMSPNNPSILNNIGLAQAMAHDFTAANATLTQAASLATARPAFRQQIQLNNAMVYAAGGKLDNAEAIARQYYSGAELSNNMGFYAHLANDDQLAKTYLNMALTQSKRFYPRAWENLQNLNAPAAASVGAPMPEEAAGQPSPEGTAPLPLSVNVSENAPPAAGAAPTHPQLQLPMPQQGVVRAEPRDEGLPLEAQQRREDVALFDEAGNRVVRPTMGYLRPPVGNPTNMPSAPMPDAPQASLTPPTGMPAGMPVQAQRGSQSATVYFNPKADNLNQMAPAAGGPNAPMPTMPQQAQPPQPAQIALPAPAGQPEQAKDKKESNWFGSLLDY